ERFREKQWHPGQWRLATPARTWRAVRAKSAKCAIFRASNPDQTGLRGVALLDNFALQVNTYWTVPAYHRAQIFLAKEDRWSKNADNTRGSLLPLRCSCRWMPRSAVCCWMSARVESQLPA